MGPVPKAWKGKCVGGEKFDPAKACNRKLIGARYYLEGFERRYGPINRTGYKEYRSPYDAVGHGTHTASTAVGSAVRGANFLGFGQGTARGGAPRARLAVYKACWNYGYTGVCSEADVLAAFDEALGDGVDVISGSFGLKPPLKLFFRSASDIGSFHAMQRGVTMVYSAGNNGPDPCLVENVAPWSISVAASIIDRSFPTLVSVDGGTLSLLGEGFVVNKVMGSLVNASTYFFGGGVCQLEYSKNKSAAGKVLVCFSSLGPVTREDAELAVTSLKATGFIFVEPLSRLSPYLTILPYVQIDILQGQQISNYLALAPPSNPPTVEIFPSKTVLGRSPAPIVAEFSSRGPSPVSPDFLKPDIAAPGVNILAAWPQTTPPTVVPEDKRMVSWNFLTGTSMSCPHVAGVVALLKSAHPDWSPAVIRSALMTTAYNFDTAGDQILAAGSIKPADPFDIGAGHINPLRAMDPGLVYDMKTSDYVIFLCNIGYTRDQIKILVLSDSTTSDNNMDNMMCPTESNPARGGSPSQSNANLNYPSITVVNLQRTTTITRMVRNVGLIGGGNNNYKISVYFVKVVSPNGVDVVVWPRVLIFSTPFKQEAVYYVTLVPKKTSQGRYDFGEIVWSDGNHYVRSPLVVSVNTSTTNADGGEVEAAADDDADAATTY
ncbi:OLC1v1007736C1 [Oldenlandia corymbosa var. corymbosa]|nr:OLC1v1007736C1 [Oldenlandia corymbosa var. corymbosa]